MTNGMAWVRMIPSMRIEAKSKLDWSNRRGIKV